MFPDELQTLKLLLCTSEVQRWEGNLACHEIAWELVVRCCDASLQHMNAPIGKPRTKQTFHEVFGRCPHFCLPFNLLPLATLWSQNAENDGGPPNTNHPSVVKPLWFRSAVARLSRRLPTSRSIGASPGAPGLSCGEPLWPASADAGHKGLRYSTSGTHSGHCSADPWQGCGSTGPAIRESSSFSSAMWSCLKTVGAYAGISWYIYVTMYIPNAYFNGEHDYQPLRTTRRWGNYVIFGHTHSRSFSDRARYCPRIRDRLQQVEYAAQDGVYAIEDSPQSTPRQAECARNIIRLCKDILRFAAPLADSEPLKLFRTGTSGTLKMLAAKPLRMQQLNAIDIPPGELT